MSPSKKETPEGASAEGAAASRPVSREPSMPPGEGFVDLSSAVPVEMVDVLGEPVEEDAPQSFGKYRLHRHLASGGMAEIFLASLDGPDGFSKPCVIKRILPEYAALDSFSRMFVNEARVAALLNHPNIVQVFEFGKLDEQYFLAMEWVQGASLDRVMRRSARANIRLGPSVAVEVGLGLAKALAYAHTATLADGTPLGIVHRDVTPGNVLVTFDGTIKLADFGVVKSAMNLNHTVAGVVKGKFAYMSPEQVSERTVDRRSDLFSLGIILYELATGSRLFKRESLEATITAVGTAQVPPLRAGVPPELQRIIRKLLALEPAARYQSGEEVVRQLELLHGSPAWATGRSTLAAAMQALRKAGALDAQPAALPSQIQSLSLPPDGSRTPATKPMRRHDTDFEVNLSDEGSTQLGQRNGERPWLVPAALAAAAIGTALFWYFVT